uniref:Uncharacterized protein LOC114345815 isoform X1 n=1 Tax=Diabrotica virgifera virgifera TaxID=50390 RepID=A0A6P7GSA2_DIAVI
MNSEESQTHCNTISQKEFYSQIFQCVAYITHKCPVVQQLFLKWSNLTLKEKYLLKYITFFVDDPGKSNSYIPILEGFNYWSNLQDREGACGFRENPFTFTFSLEDEKKIFQLIIIIDNIVTNIALRSTLCEEIKKSGLNKISKETICEQGDR